MTHRRGRKHRERSIDCRNPTGLSQFVLTGEEMRTYIDFQSISVIQTICQQYPSSKYTATERHIWPVLLHCGLSTNGPPAWCWRYPGRPLLPLCQKNKGTEPRLGSILSWHTGKPFRSWFVVPCWDDSRFFSWRCKHSIYVQVFCKVQSQLSGLKPLIPYL